MTYAEVLKNARENIGQYCKACPVCNGVACKNQIPGPFCRGNTLSALIIVFLVRAVKGALAVFSAKCKSRTTMLRLF